MASSPDVATLSAATGSPDQPEDRLDNQANQGIALRNLTRARSTTSSDNNSARRSTSNVSSQSSASTVVLWLSQLFTGTHETSLTWPKSKVARTAIAIHYVLLVGYAVAQLVQQATASNPNPAQKTLVKMQQLLGSIAHEDSLRIHDDLVKVVAALTSHTSEEAKWGDIFDKFIRMAKACGDAAVSRIIVPKDCNGLNIV